METSERIRLLQEEERERIKDFAAKLHDTITLFKPDKIPNQTTRTYNRELLRGYLRNPASDANNKSLRKLSWYLYTVSYIYRRMVGFKAYQVNLKAWNAYPVVSLVDKVDKKKIMKEYNRTIDIVRKMNMQTQILKFMLELWKSGVCYGFVYGDPEKRGEFYIHQLDNDLCKICSVSLDSGILGFMFDFSYFDQHEDFLEFYDPEFKRLYEEYKRDRVKWKVLPIDRTFCLKIDLDNLAYAIPPMSGLLEQIISLTDLQGAQDELDQLQNYKLIWGKLDTLNGTKSPDDFEVDLDLALAFMNKVNEVLPENIGTALSPMDLNTIEFKDNDAGDTNILSKAYSNVIEANGSIIMNSSKITNGTAFKLALMSECIDAMAPVTQINAWVKHYLNVKYGIDKVVVEFSDVSPYFVDDEIEKLTKLAGLSLPVKTQLASLLKENPQAQIGYDFLESEMLGLGVDRWTNPLVSANTVSADEGAPKKSAGDLSDEGEATRDKK